MNALQVEPLTRELHRRLCERLRDPLIASWGADAAAEARHCNGQSLALLRDGEPIAAGGLIHMWPGHAEAWLYVGQSARPREIAAAVRIAFEELEREFRYRRVQMFVRWEEPWRQSFAAALGFELEARHRSWAPDGADYACYARVREEGPGSSPGQPSCRERPNG